MKNEREWIRFLAAGNYVGADELAEATQFAQEKGGAIGETLVGLGILSQEKLTEAVCRYLSIPEVSLRKTGIEPETAGLISEKMALHYMLIPFEQSEGVLKVAMADPTDERAIRDVRLFTGLEVESFLGKPEEIQAAIRQCLTVALSVTQLGNQANNLAMKEQSVALGASAESDILAEDAPMLKFVHSLLQEAVIQGVSDIHWEPRQDDFIVRYRLDGKLKQKQVLATNAARGMAACLKVMAHMDVAERRIPQDGRMTFTAGGRRIDVRMSSMPVVYGEKIVVRILDPQMARRSLDSLGMEAEVKSGVQSLLQQRSGLILLVGPTGSGKTTTLYSLLGELNAEEQNIISIEDPVECQLPGVNQVQVNLPAGLSFAVGLRHILRQDPDVIMIGEIRDEETARIAITASLTGHLVLSTLHTNTAAEALVRLLDMGLEPYLLASAVSGVLSQRLVRRLCEHCKTVGQASEAEKWVLPFVAETSRLYQANGCSECLGTGFRGRIGIHEFLPYSREIKELVLSRRNAGDIERQAAAAGMRTVLEDGMQKAARGLTTVEEVLHAVSGMEGRKEEKRDAADRETFALGERRAGIRRSLKSEKSADSPKRWAAG